MISNSVDMMNIIEAVKNASNRLLATLTLLMIVIFWFCVVAFMSLQSDFNSNLPGSCSNLFKCLITIIDSWYKAGGVGEYLSGEVSAIGKDGTYKADTFRIAYDLLFFVMVATLLFDIVAGLITDSFGQLRSNEEELNSLQKSKCFMCDLESHDIGNFEYHTRYEHNIWDYFMFIHHIKCTREWEGQKDFIQKLVKNKHGNIYDVGLDKEIIESMRTDGFDDVNDFKQMLRRDHISNVIFGLTTFKLAKKFTHIDDQGNYI
jgi:hypothetical protein